MNLHNLGMKRTVITVTNSTALIDILSVDGRASMTRGNEPVSQNVPQVIGEIQPVATSPVNTETTSLFPRWQQVPRTSYAEAWATWQAAL